MDPQHLRDARQIIENLGPACSRFSDKIVLVTGAAGFLGSQFLHFFVALNASGRLEAPCKVIAWDNSLRGLPDWLREMNARGDLRWDAVDIVHPGTIPEVHFVIHAASIASPIFYRQHPIETMDANVIGLRNLLEAAVAKPVESFLFFSSSEIYGDPTPENIPTPETYPGHVSCTGPRACYDESKRFGETLCVNFWHTYHVPVKVVRPFNNYGPGLKITDGRVLPDFFRDALAGRDISILSDGKATRTFCYTSDAVTGYLLALLSEHSGEPFNIGTDDDEVSVVDLARMVAQIAGRGSKVTFRRSEDPNYTTDNPQRRCPDIAKARRMLRYAPNVSLREGLTRLHEYYLAHPNAPEG
jgi:dTDP-glucose 4,6-dehydratase/UDP-glucuronate decarboxylase